jgi:hypothetical protein
MIGISPSNSFYREDMAAYNKQLLNEVEYDIEIPMFVLSTETEV